MISPVIRGETLRGKDLIDALEGTIEKCFCPRCDSELFCARFLFNGDEIDGYYHVCDKCNIGFLLDNKYPSTTIEIKEAGND